MNSVIIIAEAGINHNGSVELAKRLIDSAALAGVDFVKFQTFKTELNISKTAKKAEYQISNDEKSNETQFEMVKKLELSFEDFRQLKNYCVSKSVGFLSTGFDFPSVDFLDEIGQPFFKIPSGELTNKPFLQHVAGKCKPVILSTGMADMNEISDALKILIKGGIQLNRITVLHCNTEYPTPMQDVNLKAMLTIREKFKVKVGYSDHTQGIEIPIAAVALGAAIIEKHFTLDRRMPGPDHSSSLEPNELEQMVKSIRNIEKALGDGVKKPSPSEIKNISVVRKSIHYTRNLHRGNVLTELDLIFKRPGTGISPIEIDKLISRTLVKDVLEDTIVKWEDLE